MTGKLIRFTKPLAQALVKGSHRKETTQQQFVVDAVESALLDLGDDEIQKLVSQHQVLTEEKKGTPNHEA